MSPEHQSIAALAVVGLTTAWFLVRAWRKRRNPGCGHDCGCPAEQLKRR